MSRIVVLSNRLPAMRPGRGRPEIAAGGLASVVFGALKKFSDSLWFGWNGKLEPAERAGRLSTQRIGNVDLAGLPLTEREVEDYYTGFCNSALWPLFHCFQGRVALEPRQERRYREVQARFAAALLPLLRDDDLVWVHDYHFLLAGQELRRLGWRGRTGFFLHVPFPPHDLWELLPDPRGFIQALTEYDLVGFQVPSYLENYVHCCRRELGASWSGGRIQIEGRTQRAGSYPVGIEPGDFLPPQSLPRAARRHGVLQRVVRGRQLILGVDRLDYTKGIPERILAYEHFLDRHPRWRKKVSFIQIGSPTRTSATHYVELKRRVEALAGRLNGEMAEHDWVPLRYLYRSYQRPVLATFYREADVGLVTPLRDGMNLVAMEFVAAQDTVDPGVLILSRCAGAAEVLSEALIVNPYIPSEVGEAIAHALAMPLEERLRRHRALLSRVLAGTASVWADSFIRDLEGCPRRRASERPAASALPARAQRP